MLPDPICFAVVFLKAANFLFQLFSKKYRKLVSNYLMLCTFKTYSLNVSLNTNLILNIQFKCFQELVTLFDLTHDGILFYLHNLEW